MRIITRIVCGLILVTNTKPLLEFLQGFEAMRNAILLSLGHFGERLALELENRIPA